jgi:hypothetical protein
VSVYCTTSFSVCSWRRTKMPIIYPDLRLDYKVATHPSKSDFLFGSIGNNHLHLSRSQDRCTSILRERDRMTSRILAEVCTKI